MLAFLDNYGYTCPFYRMYVTEKYILVEIVARNLLRGLFFQVIIGGVERTHSAEPGNNMKCVLFPGLSHSLLGSL